MDVDLPKYNDDAYSEDGIIVPETPNPLGETEYASFFWKEYRQWSIQIRGTPVYTCMHCNL